MNSRKFRLSQKKEKYMKKIGVLLLFLFVSFKGNAQTTIFNDLLQKHVTNEGVVDYKNFNRLKLKKYLNYLETTKPHISWSENKQKAFWMNVYNAYTIQIILENYPLKSIRDIYKEGKTVWKIPFVRVGGKTHTLDDIEHRLLLKELFDPRIHVGVNCASLSCPKLSNIAFTEANIEDQLEGLMKAFVNDPSKNKLTENACKISAIFNWFEQDFVKNGTIIAFLNRYSKTQLQPNKKISYLEYNWSLNGK